MGIPPLASGPQGTDALPALLDTVLDALRTGTAARRGPLPPGGPDTVGARVADAAGDILPRHGDPEALRVLVTALAEGAADPAHPLCAAHLHAPPLAVAAAADLAASVLNPSLDSWDQAPAATALEALFTRALARETGAADALVTTGGTESNHLAVLLAREALGTGLRVVHGAAAHHSVHRAAWLLGLPHPVVVPTPTGTLDPAALDEALTRTPGPHLVVATAGTTDAGLVDPLPQIADRCAAHRARLHTDAAYGAGLLFSERRRTLLTGLEAADTVALDLHKLGWQPIPAGLLTVKDTRDLAALHHRADYLNADDDTDAGLPDLLARSPRTSRRPDVLKAAVTLKTLGRTGLGALVDTVCDLAEELASLIHDRPGLALHAPPTLSTVLFRPTRATDATVAAVRRTLLTTGRAVLGRARADGRLWLKATLLNPHTRRADLATLLTLVETFTEAETRGNTEAQVEAETQGEAEVPPPPSSASSSATATATATAPEGHPTP
ncbi:pyridoxal phosphate-dependent decarboxylase family protein [Streptomyces sp. NPDC057245]|uniref:pyridoxal phosphate-dependent decarboxylase family protein n=1 Tax=Streptomyces sp. NPDC057245 TaxID=3346065 RepID=UPI003626A28B